MLLNIGIKITTYLLCVYLCGINFKIIVMKKILFLLAMLPMMWACSSSSDDIPEEHKEEIIDIVGVWSNGDYFVSFSSDGYYTSYLTPKFIDSGNYVFNQKDKIVKSNNDYFGRETNITISLINNKLTCNISSTDVLGNAISKNMTFTKIDENPQGDNNILVGKVYEALYGGGFGKCQWDFTSNYAATFSTKEVKPQVRNHYYIYRPPFMFTQSFKPKGASLSSFYEKCDKGEVIKYYVKIENGNITHLGTNLED